jgi:hypothetical protein
MLTAMLSRTPAPMSTYADVPASLDALVAKCLARETENRFTTVIELGDALEAILLEDTGSRTEVTTVPDTAHLIEDHREDAATWVDGPPPAPTAPGITNPLTTLPGIAPPAPGTPWPIGDSRKRGR